MAKHDELRAGFPGIAIFKSAFMAVLPRKGSSTVTQTVADPLATGGMTLSQALQSRKRRAPSGGGRNRTYTVVTTFYTARRGTKRARQLDIVLAHTDVRSARLAGAEAVDITYAEQIGCIKFDN